MKKALNLQGLILIAALICPFVMKAQIDTAGIGSEHIEQYIHPPLIDSTYEQNLGLHYTDVIAHSILSCTSNFSDELYWIKKVAQRYEVRNDSVKISGISILAKPYNDNIPDTLIVGIMNTSMSVLSQKTFIVNPGIPEMYARHYEFMFDDTITVYDDYMVFFDLLSVPCTLGNYPNNRSFAMFFYKKDYSGSGTEYVPCEVGTKYKPYVAFCYNRGAWMSVDEVDWSNAGYDLTAKYNRSNCDTNVYAPIAIFPIRVLEDSIPQGDSTIADTASSALSAGLLNEESVRVYPNPASEVLNVASDYNILNVAIFDAMNRLVEEKEVNAKNIRISLAKRPSAVYFIKVRTDRGSTMRKFVIR